MQEDCTPTPAAFGPVVGGVAGALYLFANSIANTAALARFFMDTLAGVWPALAQPMLNFVALVVLYGGLALVNIRGTRAGNRLTITFGILKFVPLALLVIVGAFSIDPANLAWTGLPAIDSIGDAALILFFAFQGIETGLSISGETRNPARTIPRAIALALGMVALFYVGLADRDARACWARRWPMHRLRSSIPPAWCWDPGARSCSCCSPWCRSAVTLPPTCSVHRASPTHWVNPVSCLACSALCIHDFRRPQSPLPSTQRPLSPWQRPAHSGRSPCSVWRVRSSST